MNKRKTGAKYEEKAAEYLKNRGYRILERNYRCGFGEIDLVALEGDCLVFVEVKYRKDLQKGSPLEAVGAAKQWVIGRVAGYYLLTHPNFQKNMCRFDVVGITGEEIALVENAFFLPG